jgi:hypothetical protein
MYVKRLNTLGPGANVIIHRIFPVIYETQLFQGENFTIYEKIHRHIFPDAMKLCL